jgi:hypothetical protein
VEHIAAALDESRNDAGTLNQKKSRDDFDDHFKWLSQKLQRRLRIGTRSIENALIIKCSRGRSNQTSV